MAEQRHYQGIRKGSPFVIQSLRKKTNKRTNEQIQRKNKREKESSGDYDTLLYSGVSLQPKGMPGKGGEGRVQSKSLGKWGQSAKATTIWRT